MGKKYDFDYIVIGSGPAGSTAAINLAKAKKRVALVEGHFFGGSNINSREVPYTVALNFSHSYKKVSSLPEFRNQDFTFSLPNAVSHQLSTVIKCGGNDKKPYEQVGITCISGFANFLDKNTINVDGKQYTSRNFILATGARLKVLGISIAKSASFLTPDAALKSRRLPKVVVVVGGGSTGCEVANYYAELGVKVIILETAERLLPHEDKEVGEAIAESFNSLGVMVLTNSKVVALEQDAYSKRIIFMTNNTEKMIRTDCVVLATGSQPVFDYGLENAGVKYKNTGITVDRYFETSTKNIYAIGDALGKESSTDRAEYEAAVLVSNLINKTKNTPNYHGFIRSTNTQPAVATIGYNEDDLIKRDRKYKVAIKKLVDTPAGNIYEETFGFIKLISDKNNHLLGATIVAPNAELLAPELSLAIRHNLTLAELASTPHSWTSFNYAIKLAAKDLLTKK